MQITRHYKYKLKPTREQEYLFRECAGVCRLVYNLAREQRRIWGKSHGCNFHTAAADLKDLRREFDFVGAVSQTAQQQALKDLDKAFQSFFAGRASFPSPRKKFVNDSFRFVGREIKIEKLNRRWSQVKLPKIGWVKMRLSRPVQGQIRNATVKRDALGWHISICTMREIKDQAPIKRACGVDRGVTVPAMTSDGEAFYMPDELSKWERRRRKVQRTASKRKRGSKRHAKAMRRASRISSKISRIRDQWQHETALKLAKIYGVVVLEDLRTKNMTRSAKGSVEEPGRMVKQKSGLNRSILNVGWFGLQMKLKYKLEERGGHLQLVDPKHTSQCCSACETVDNNSRKSQALFLCTSCGFHANADHNAAVNILRRGSTPSGYLSVSTDVELGGLGLSSAETSTTRQAA
ncbi:RNA-guided endonuclease TnpB family protein [Sulfitobacter sp. R18_1]|uniref:RNA-guided endonuclease InsQ/TnpB family protein n=1 Tax=Sulfitobacter sp. R18_1 TaxID=2821104 RepID=UPI001ADA0EDE|nr:RNA-guided endonuclease TnpB family protein [Sulfitobacter sp. R18_1]MBO9428316.1 transposase [Sulfitobacter sp. R18_1]